MNIVESLREECTTDMEMWNGTITPPLQCGYNGHSYVIWEWDDVKNDYVTWIEFADCADMVMRYFRAKCFEGVVLDCDDIGAQFTMIFEMVHKGELHR